MDPIRPAMSLALALLAPSVAMAQTVTVNTGGKQVQITIDEAATLPADFPDDVVLPANHEVVRVERSGENTTLVLDLGSDPAAASTLDAFDTGMRANAWTQAHVAPPDSGRASAWEKDRRAVIAWQAPGPNGTRLQLQLLPRP